MRKVPAITRESLKGAAMSRNLLAQSKLEGFKQWLGDHGIPYRPGRGDFEVIQVLADNGTWQCIFYQLDKTVHYTVAGPLVPLVRRFINDRCH